MSVPVWVCAPHGEAGGCCVCMFKGICMCLSFSVCSFVSAPERVQSNDGGCENVSRETCECGC